MIDHTIDKAFPLIQQHKQNNHFLKYANQINTTSQRRSHYFTTGGKEKILVAKGFKEPVQQKNRFSKNKPIM
jgi:hypothetical protein